MNTLYGLDAYRSHDLNISMKTSSGDTIQMDFSNKNSASLKHSQNDNSSSTQMKFSSMQSFSFKVETNGIDEQDKKEIEEFMKIAQPRIDSFLKELEEDKPGSAVGKVAREIASIFEPSKERDENTKNFIKNSIVETFDNAMKGIKLPEVKEIDIFEEAKKLLEKTLKEFEDFNKNIYG